MEDVVPDNVRRPQASACDDKRVGSAILLWRLRQVFRLLGETLEEVWKLFKSPSLLP